MDWGSMACLQPHELLSVTISWLASTVSGAVGSAAVDAVSWFGLDNLWAGVHEESSGIFAILPLAVSIAIVGVVFYKAYAFRILSHFGGHKPTDPDPQHTHQAVLYLMDVAYPRAVLACRIWHVFVLGCTASSGPAQLAYSTTDRRMGEGVANWPAICCTVADRSVS